MTVDFGRRAGRRAHTVLLGRNGAGKTSLLRALALGLTQENEASALLGELSGSSVRRVRTGRHREEARIELWLQDPRDRERQIRTTTTIRRDRSGQERVHKTVCPEQDFPWDRIFVGGYGVNRGARHREARAGYNRLAALRSLFSDRYGRVPAAAPTVAATAPIRICDAM